MVKIEKEKRRDNILHVVLVKKQITWKRIVGSAINHNAKTAKKLGMRRRVVVSKESIMPTSLKKKKVFSSMHVKQQLRLKTTHGISTAVAAIT